jgi:hypothetical protein
VRITGERRGQAVVAMASTDARLAGIASSIRVIPDVPKPGGFTLDFRTSVPHLAPLSVSTTHLLYHLHVFYFLQILLEFKEEKF